VKFEMLIGTEENRRKVTIDIPQKPGVRPGTMKELVPSPDLKLASRPIMLSDWLICQITPFLKAHV
jgi:hypothetical protein